MHTVLDGEATAGRSPGARSSPGRRSCGPRRIRRPPPPVRRALARAAGLSARRASSPPVMAGVSQRTAGDEFRQPFAPAGVIAIRFQGRPGRPGKSANANFRSNEMSQEKSGSKRKIWIGGAIAAAAVVLAISSGIDFPPGSKDTAGTIVPAQRYRAAPTGKCGRREAGRARQGTSTTAREWSPDATTSGQATRSEPGPEPRSELRARPPRSESGPEPGQNQGLNQRSESGLNRGSESGPEPGSATQGLNQGQNQPRPTDHQGQNQA